MSDRSRKKKTADVLHRRPSEIIDPAARDDIRLLLDLSPREFQIVLHIIDGLSQQEIARRIGCSRHTVDSHVRRIFRKLGVGNRAAAAGRLLVAYAEWARHRR